MDLLHKRNQPKAKANILLTLYAYFHIHLGNCIMGSTHQYKLTYAV